MNAILYITTALVYLIAGAYHRATILYVIDKIKGQTKKQDKPLYYILIKVEDINDIINHHNKANKDIHYVFKYELNRRYNGDYYKLTKDDIKIESFN